MHVAVIGGGLMGVASAWYLTEAGHRVTLLERNEALAAEGSFANGGILHAGHADPWNTPAVVGRLLRWIGREESPLLLRPARLPRLLGWGTRFLWHSRAADYRRVTELNTRLAVYSQQLMGPLRERAGIDYAAARRGSLKLFHAREALEAAVADARRIEPFGVRSQRLDRDEVIALEPALAGIAERIAGGVYFPADESGDACAFVRELGRVLRERGTDVRTNARVDRLMGDRRGARGVVVDGEALEADACVLATGVDAPRLARPFGLRLPIEPVKGYSATIELDATADAPRTPIIDEAHQVVITRLGDRLRVAGTAEFAGFDRAIRERRVEIVARQALSNFPALAERVDPDAVSRWACLRPVTVDGAPILGPTPVPGLLLNVGAGHLGWTFAAGTGRIVADLADGRTPELDVDGLRVDRFI